MRIYFDDLARRTGGALYGLGLTAVGVYSLSMVGEAPDAVLEDRTMWLGITMLIAGVVSFAMSWLTPDLSGVWCRAPRFLPKKKKPDETS
ncbi:MAG: hypothetical protein HOK21_05435 [Rhodospirillaceae bacterium]|jgi:hypothetical protein|nr:hypothetical protein [Rhodospirillaceae bacterium]MBT4690013.1 hypothetical protein [Rhodospirillaceae bacterium]MBT5081185.1 hypothetical protein [Rhodospirillaceae bacterium]MBT5523507.1 hypothetical protein [Rhodospirillaceae bacterium]MBT5880518.1 hypothetical protein [Rhodospirillaceae bacterium]